MDIVRTSTWPRVRICGLALALGLWLVGLGSATAETAAECRYLAARLGVAAACGSGATPDPPGGTAPLPPQSPADVAPPPPAPQAERISSFRQTWPQSAPWGRDWSKEGWGD